MTPEKDGCYHPETEDKLIELVKLANARRTQLRVRGSSHSVSGAIFTDGSDEHYRVHVREAPPSDGINVVLDRYRAWKVIDWEQKLVEAQAGICLGADPSDPSGTATQESGLLWNLAQLGWALANTGGITHQTIAGFTATGSSGGSVKYSSNDNLSAFRLIDGRGNVHTIAQGDTAFQAMAPSLGLFGVVSTITFKCSDNFAVEGTESTERTEECSVDLFGSGLETFLRDTHYARIEWWPQKGLERAVVWRAVRLEQGSSYTHKRFDRFRWSADLAQHVVAIVYSLLCNLDNITQAKATLEDNFTHLRRGLVEGATRRHLGPPGRLLATAFAEVVEFLIDLLFDACRAIRWLLKKKRPFIFPKIANLFIPLDKHGPKKFADQAWAALPMDNSVSDVLLPTTFTEAWIPITRTAEVMELLRSYFYDGVTDQKSYDRTGTYGWEVYAAKPSSFWLSPSYTDGKDEWRHGVVRIDPYWYADSGADPEASLFNAFWNRLREHNIPFRLHWAKYLPTDPKWAEYFISQYPRWDAFMAERKKFDPHGIFLTSYWRDRLGLGEEPHATVAVAPERKGNLARRAVTRPLAALVAALVALGVILIWSDVPVLVKSLVVLGLLVVVGLRVLAQPGRVARVGAALGLLLVPVLALAAVAALLARIGVPTLDPEWSLLIGGLTVFAVTWIYLSPWWARKPRSRAWYEALIWAFVLIVLPPVAVWAVDKVDGDARGLEQRVEAVSRLDVIVLQEGPGTIPARVPETRGWAVTSWVGRVTDDTIDWGSTGAPPQTAPTDTDRVLLLAIDGALPERLDDAAELGSALPAPDEQRRWLALADAAAPRSTPTFAILQTTDRKRQARWRDALETSGRAGDARRLEELAGHRSPIDLAMLLAVEAPGADQDLALAARHRPYLFFDRDERYATPLNIDRVLKSGRLRLCGGLQAIGGLCPQIWGSADLHNGGTNLSFKAAEVAKETADSTIYVNVTRSGNDHDNAIYLDYWWYLPDNPSGAVGGAFCGVGFVIAGRTCLDHQSDWEGVTVILDGDSPSPAPTAVAYAQHGRVVRYTWAALQEIWRRDTGWRFHGRYDTRERPLVFIARGTHASFPKRCPHDACRVARIPFGKSGRSDAPEERHDGDQPWPRSQDDCPTVCVLSFPTRNSGRDRARWNAFSGYWGTSKCVLGRACSSSDPPRSPGFQDRFRSPWCETRAVKLERGEFAADPQAGCPARRAAAFELTAEERLLALGDSFSSGQGAGSYDPGSTGEENTCFRSPDAWPQRLAAELRLKTLPPLACSGAVIDEVLTGLNGHAEADRRQSQISRIRGEPGAITLTIGGNDFGFAGVLVTCVTRDCVRVYDRPSRDRLEARIARLRPKLTHLYRAIRQAAPGTRLIVVGYPRLFPDAVSGEAAGQCSALASISARETAYLNAKLDALNAASEAAAKEVGVEFIDVTDAFDGRELRCAGASYVNRLSRQPDLRPASYHPNAAGHARLAVLVAAAVRRAAPPATAR